MSEYDSKIQDFCDYNNIIKIGNEYGGIPICYGSNVIFPNDISISDDLKNKDDYICKCLIKNDYGENNENNLENVPYLYLFMYNLKEPQEVNQYCPYDCNINYKKVNNTFNYNDEDYDKNKTLPQLMLLRILPTSTNNNQCYIIIRTWWNSNIRTGITCRYRENLYINFLSENGRVRSISNSEKVLQVGNELYITKKKPDLVYNVDDNDLGIVNGNPYPVQENYDPFDDFLAYIYTDRRVSGIKFLAMFKSVLNIQPDCNYFNFDQVNDYKMDEFSPNGLKTIIERKDLNDINEENKFVDVLKSNLERILDRAPYKFSFTLRNNLTMNLSKRKKNKNMINCYLYFSFTIEYDNINGNETICSISCPILLDNKVKEFKFTAKENITVQNYINAYENNNKIQFSKITVNSELYGYELKCNNFFDLFIGNRDDKNYVKLILYNGSNYLPYLIDDTNVYKEFEMEIVNFGCIPIENRLTNDYYNISNNITFIFDDDLINKDLYPYYIKGNDNNYKIKLFDNIQSKMEECDYNLLVQNYSDCFTMFLNDNIYSSYKNLNNDNNTISCLYYEYNGSTNTLNRNVNEYSVKISNTNIKCYELLSDRIQIYPIIDSIASLQLFNCNRDEEKDENGNYKYKYGYINEENKMVIDYLPFVLYKKINFMFKNCIQFDYIMDEDDINVILSQNRIEYEISLIDFNPNQIVSSDYIVIYKLGFKKLNDGLSSNDMGTETEIENMCIYFTIKWNETNTSLTLDCYNKIDIQTNAISYYNSINSSSYSELNNKLEITFLDEQNEMDMLIDFNNKECKLTNFSKLKDLLIPCDGNYYNLENDTFYCYPIKTIKLKNGDEPTYKIKQINSFYSNSVYLPLEEHLNDESLSDIINKNYMEYKSVEFLFEITLEYLNITYKNQIGYLSLPKHYNGITTFRKFGMIRNNQFYTEILESFPLIILNKLDNSIQTLDFKLKDDKENIYTDLNKERCYIIMRNHNYNYPNYDKNWNEMNDISNDITSLKIKLIDVICKI